MILICVDKYDKLPLSAKEDDYAYCKENAQLYQFTKNSWKPLNQQGKNFGINQYELNKMLIAQMPDADLDKAKNLLHSYTHKRWHGYFMLLCNDIHYYTVLNFDQEDNDDSEFIENLIIELLQEKGTIKLIDYNEDKTAIECWIKNDKECLMFMLFDYDWGVIPCQ